MVRLVSRRNGSATIRVLILIECAVTADMLARELERGGLKLTSERADSEQAFTHALRVFAPDVILSAPTVHDVDARTALKLLQAVRPTAPFILVAESFDEQTAVSCLRAGAETVVVRDDLARLAPATQKALSVREPLRTLTRRQLEVLRLVTEGHTSKEIATGLGLSVKTVETHRGEGMRRLGVDDVPSLVRYAVRVGLIPQGQAVDGPASGATPNRRVTPGRWSALELAAD